MEVRTCASGSTRKVGYNRAHQPPFLSLAHFINDSMDDPAIRAEPYPAGTKRTAGAVDGVHTDVMVVSFADKIVITITQEGRLAQWVCCFFPNPLRGGVLIGMVSFMSRLTRCIGSMQSWRRGMRMMRCCR